MKIVGNKQQALFDAWSFGHLFFYYIVTIVFLRHLEIRSALLIYVVMAYSWEFLERALENLDHHKHFFKQKEGWVNRYIGDVLSGLIGLFAAYYGFW